MDVTPSGIRKVQFREKLRGYHPEDVDAFVAEVANRVQALEQQLEAATARAAEAEGRASESTGSEDQLRRTLVLAQRTADLAVQEARDEAARILAEAQAHHDSVVSAAADAEQRATEDARRTATEELARYAEAREQLANDVRALDEYVREQRSRLAGALGEARDTVDQGLYLQQPPQLHDVHVAPPATASAAAAEDVEPVAAEPAEVDAPGGPADITPEIGDEPTAVDDDPFITELRRAVTDTEPLGPRDSAAAEPGDYGDLYDGDDDGGRSRRPWRR